jgi:hypothetical protein
VIAKNFYGLEKNMEFLLKRVRANPFLEGRIANWTGHHYPFKDYYPKNHCEKLLKMQLYRKTHSFIMMCLQKKLNILLLKYGITVEN